MYKYDLENTTFKIENIIFCKLIVDAEYRQIIMPILKSKFFDYPYDLIFKAIEKYYIDGLEDISIAQIIINIEEENNIPPEDLKKIRKFLQNCFKTDENKERFLFDVDIKYAIKETEKFAQQIGLEKAILESVNIIDERPEEKNNIVNIISEALNISVQRDIGLNYFENAKKRFESYKEHIEKVPFKINILNKTTYGGAERGTLNTIMASTGIGKTLIMSSLASDYIMCGYNVLYVTLEISEKRIGSRIDANLLNIPIHTLKDLSVEELCNRFKQLETQKHGEFVVKQYGTGTINYLHIKSLIKELKIKYGFMPDVIFVDYINLMRPLKSIRNTNSYTEIKYIAEELRGMAVDLNCVLWTATQTNRDGINGEEVALDSVSESKALPDTSDLFIAISQTEQQKIQNIYLFNILKNRYAGFNNRPFILGVNKDYMKIYEPNEEQLQELDLACSETNVEPQSSLENEIEGIINAEMRRK